MEPRAFGYFEVTIESVRPGDRYHYIVDGEKVRPCGFRSQPDGVHQDSAVVDPDVFGWTDQAWRGLPLKDLIIYELHTGTFTATGTFNAIIPHLEYLKEKVGVTAIELMPVAQFPGRRNWGYDGTYLYAPHLPTAALKGCRASSMRVTVKDLRWSLTSSTTISGRRETSSATSGHISPTATRHRGDRRSITMGRTATM